VQELESEPDPDPDPDPEPEPEPEPEPAPSVHSNSKGYFGPEADHFSKEDIDWKGHLDRQRDPTFSKKDLYHQTDEKSTRLIVGSNMMKIGSEGSAGPGIYFATNETETRKAQRTGFVFRCNVWLGQVRDLGKRDTYKDFQVEYGSLSFPDLVKGGDVRPRPCIDCGSHRIMLSDFLCPELACDGLRRIRSS
jgi:hypothetical protein